MPSNFPLEMIREAPLFRSFSNDEIEQILAAADDRDYDPGTTIIQEGTQDRAVYVILDGDVQVVLPTPVFEETTIVTLGPGSVFGEVAFFHAAPHVATVRCVTRVCVVQWSRERFDRLLAKQSLAAYKLAANAATILAERLQATDRWIEDMIQRHQDEEVAARWREFRHRIVSGHRFASYGPIGSFCPGSS